MSKEWHLCIWEEGARWNLFLKPVGLSLRSSTTLEAKSVCLSVWLSDYSTVWLPACLSEHLTVRLFNFLSDHLTMWLSDLPAVWLSNCLCDYLSNCLSVWPIGWLSVCPTECLTDWLFNWVTVLLTFGLSYRLLDCLTDYVLFIRLSNWLSVRLPVFFQSTPFSVYFMWHYLKSSIDLERRPSISIRAVSHSEAGYVLICITSALRGNLGNKNRPFKIKLDPLFPVILLGGPSSLESSSWFQVQSREIRGVITIPLTRRLNVLISQPSLGDS